MRDFSGAVRELRNGSANSSNEIVAALLRSNGCSVLGGCEVRPSSLWFGSCCSYCGSWWGWFPTVNPITISFASCSRACVFVWLAWLAIDSVIAD